MVDGSRTSTRPACLPISSETCAGEGSAEWSVIQPNGSCRYDHAGVQDCAYRAHRTLSGSRGVRVAIRCSRISNPCGECTRSALSFRCSAERLSSCDGMRYSCGLNLSSSDSWHVRAPEAARFRLFARRATTTTSLDGAPMSDLGADPNWGKSGTGACEQCCEPPWVFVV